MKIAAFILVTTGSLTAAEMVARPVVLQADEKGSAVVKKPAYFSVFLGNRFSLPETASADAVQNFATTHIVRQGEAIYTGTGPAPSGSGFAPVPEPALRLEWETPFERVPFLPSWSAFSTQLSLEAVFSGTHNIASSSGNYTYQNNQANDPALKNLSYAGGISVSEKRQNLTPMVGIGVELSNATLKKWSDMRFLVRLGAGLSLQNGQRSYHLSLSPQYVTATNNATYSDTYVIKSSFVQSYAMAPLVAGRIELGTRLRLSPRLHLSLVGSLTVLYGILPYDSIGSFTEQAGADKIIYQKIVATTSDQDYLGLIPAAFLALSLEI